MYAVTTNLVILVVVIFLAQNFCVHVHGEPRIAKSLSSSKKSNSAHQTINLDLDQPSESAKETNAELDDKESLINLNVTKANFNSTNSTGNSSSKNNVTVPVALEKAMNLTVNPLQDFMNLPTLGIGGLLLPKLDLSSWGWTSEMGRIAQVMIGFGFYLIALYIKGLLISWGIGEIKRKVADKIAADGGLDALFDFAEFAITSLADKYFG